MQKKRIELPHSHSIKGKMIIEEMPSLDTINAVAEAMNQLGNPSRLRIFWLLCHCEECVINIAAATEMSSPAVSHHLKLLKDAGLIVANRNGKEMYYRAADTDMVLKLHHTIEEIARISCPEDIIENAE